MKKKTAVQKAIKTLIKALEKDPGYRISWQANIAMSFVDEYAFQGGRDSRKKVHNISNHAANRFLRLLCNDYQYPKGR